MRRLAPLDSVEGEGQRRVFDAHGQELGVGDVFGWGEDEVALAEGFGFGDGFGEGEGERGFRGFEEVEAGAVDEPYVIGAAFAEIPVGWGGFGGVEGFAGGGVAAAGLSTALDSECASNSAQDDGILFSFKE